VTRRVRACVAFVVLAATLSVRAAADAPPAAAPGATAAAAEKNGDSDKAGFQVVDVAGLKEMMRRARGRVVLLHFWASWCSPCLQELPLIDKFAHDMKPRGLEVLSISLDDPARMGPRVAALLRKSAPHLTATLVQFGDADDLIGAIDPTWPGAIPALFAYDSRGQARGSLLGVASRAELDGLVGGLLKAAAASDGAAAPEATAGAGKKK